MSDERATSGQPFAKKMKMDSPGQETYSVKLLEEFARSLDVPNDIVQVALTIWADLETRIAVRGQEQHWFVCLLYIASIDLRLPYGSSDPTARAGHLSPPSVTVSDLLAKSFMTVHELVKKVNEIKEARHLSATFLEHFVNMERKYCVSFPLFVKFEKMCDEIFLQNATGSLMNGTSGSHSNFVISKKKLIWTLFVYIKGERLDHVGELVTPFALLLACLEHVMTMTPSVWLKPPYSESALSQSPSTEHRFLPILCEKYGARLDEVLQVVDSYFMPVKPFLPVNDGVLDCRALTEAYIGLYQREADINELLFLSHHPHLSVVNPDQANNNVENLGAGQATPVRMALSTVQQLRNLLNAASDHPGEQLLKFYQNCAENPLEKVQENIEKWRGVFVRELCQTERSHRNIAENKFMLALRLYYRVIETLLVQEEERLSRGDFSHLLGNTLFHASLLACSAQVVLMTYHLTGPASNSTDSLQFPWVLQIFEVLPYDFYKVLESFIKAEPKLSKDAVKHLQQIETSILESLAWQSESSLFRALENYEPIAPTDAPRLETTSLLYLSPQVPRYASQSRTGNRRWSQSLSHFFQKVCRLGYNRIESLSNLLTIQPELQRKIWTCFEYCITERYHLMKNRHLDQIVMCCIFGICKVMDDRDMRFKNIVSKYRTMLHAKPETYKKVEIRPGEYDSVIGFYNNVFMQDIKSYILRFAADKKMPMAPAPRYNSPVYSVPGRNNFYVSPMKESPFKTPQNPDQMTPRTARLYCFGEDNAAEKLKHINEAMESYWKKTPTPTKSSSKCLNFDDQSDSQQISGASAKMVRRILNSASAGPAESSESVKRFEWRVKQPT